MEINAQIFHMIIQWTCHYHISDFKGILINLIAKLVQCHHGFWFSNSHRMWMFGNKNIVSCYGGSSFIKRGYLFSSAYGELTITPYPVIIVNIPGVR